MQGATPPGGVGMGAGGVWGAMWVGGRGWCGVGGGVAWGMRGWHGGGGCCGRGRGAGGVLGRGGLDCLTVLFKHYGSRFGLPHRAGLEEASYGVRQVQER